MEMHATARREGLAEAKSEGCDFFTPRAIAELRESMKKTLAEKK
jgi:hypothetical protein